jgi:hypothetical protein
LKFKVAAFVKTRISALSQARLREEFGGQGFCVEKAINPEKG